MTPRTPIGIEGLFRYDDLNQNTDASPSPHKKRFVAGALNAATGRVTFVEATSPIVDRYEFEPGRWIVKINPVVNWTRRDTWTYLADHDLPAKVPEAVAMCGQSGVSRCERMR